MMQRFSIDSAKLELEPDIGTPPDPNIANIFLKLSLRNDFDALLHQLLIK